MCHFRIHVSHNEQLSRLDRLYVFILFLSLNHVMNTFLSHFIRLKVMENYQDTK